MMLITEVLHRQRSTGPGTEWPVQYERTAKNGSRRTISTFVLQNRTAIPRVVMLVLAVSISVTSSGWAERPIIGGLFYLTGCTMVGIGTMGRVWCSLYICGYKSDSLVTSGPYSMCRNPLYLFSLLGSIGVGFATKKANILPVLAILY